MTLTTAALDDARAASHDVGRDAHTEGTAADDTRGPLAGVVIVDISGSYAGPTTAMYLADLGATVYKVEKPGTGDDARSWGPPFIGETSAWFASANRNKSSIALNLRAPGGRAALDRLLDRADVLITNLNPSKLAAHGLDSEAIRARHRHLVFCAISGFGLTGPDSSLPGYDLVAQARSGLMSVTGQAGGMPQRVSTALSDIAAAMVATIGILAALRRRDTTGHGDVVDVSLLDTDLALMAPRIASYLAGESEPAPSGGTDSVIAVYQPFDTQDQPIVLAVGSDAIWKRMCEVVQCDDLLEDPRLQDNAGRRTHRQAVIDAVAAKLSARPAADWLTEFAAAGVPAAPVASLSDVVSDPQVVSRRAVLRLGESAQPGVAAPWRLTSQPDPPRQPAPALGADTVTVLLANGFTDQEVEALVEEEAAWAPPAA